jgi:hypothetical protein
MTAAELFSGEILLSQVVSPLSALEFVSQGTVLFAEVILQLP